MSPRILIIDDEAHLRHMMRLTLETAGYEVEEAGDGLHGLEVLGDGSGWSAVLLDQRMPGMDGLATLWRLKERAPEVRVIMVTAFASIELAVEAMKLGATDFVRKPMTPDILRHTVAAALAKPSVAPRVPQPTSERLPQRRRVEMLTMNGFRFVRALADAPDERRFLVQNPAGREQEVIVDIDAEAVAMVERLTRRHLPYDSAFWTSCAERVLVAYLWDQGRIPSERLTVVQVDRNDLEIAARWEDTMSREAVL
jgi:DNA-binding response OmpR family regulator